MISDRIKHTTSSWYASLTACVLAFALCFGAVSPAAYADVRKADIIYGFSVDSRGLSVTQCPSVDAEYALVMAADGTVYFERNATAPTQIASITKIMTALLALESAPLETVITVSNRAATVGESSASLMAGDMMTLDVALEALLLSSGNDAAIAVAENIGRIIAGDPNLGDAEAEEVFVNGMTQRAAELGCTDTVFRNPHGLDHDRFAGDQHSCAADVAIMAQAAMKNEAFRSTVALPSKTIEVIRGGDTTKAEVLSGSGAINITEVGGTPVPLQLSTTDELLTSGFEGACGIKTGFTALAGPSFAGAANRDGVEMYAIVIHSSSESQRFTDAATLLDWVYDHTTEYRLINVGGAAADGASTALESPTVAEVAHSDWIDRTVKATVSDPDQAIGIFDLNGNISQTVSYETLSGNIRQGDKVGTMVFKQRNEEMARIDLIAAEDVDAPDLFQGIGVWWDRLFRGFSGQPSVAESVLYNETPLVVDKTNGQ